MLLMDVPYVFLHGEGSTIVGNHTNLCGICCDVGSY